MWLHKIIEWVQLREMNVSLYLSIYKYTYCCTYTYVYTYIQISISIYSHMYLNADGLCAGLYIIYLYMCIYIKKQPSHTSIDVRNPDPRVVDIEPMYLTWIIHLYLYTYMYIYICIHLYTYTYKHIPDTPALSKHTPCVVHHDPCRQVCIYACSP